VFVFPALHLEFFLQYVASVSNQYLFPLDVPSHVFLRQTQIWQGVPLSIVWLHIKFDMNSCLPSTESQKGFKEKIVHYRHDGLITGTPYNSACFNYENFLISASYWVAYCSKISE